MNIFKFLNLMLRARKKQGTEVFGNPERDLPRGSGVSFGKQHAFFPAEVGRRFSGLIHFQRDRGFAHERRIQDSRNTNGIDAGG